MVYNLLIFIQMEEHLLQYLLIDLCLRVPLHLGIMVINVSIISKIQQKKKKKIKRKEYKKYKIKLKNRLPMQLMLLLIQMEEYNRLIIVALEIVISHLVATYPIRQRIRNFHDQIACLKSKLIFI